MSDPSGAVKLPLLPLNGGVVLPYMVVTITLESDEARAAVEAAERADRMVLLLPRKTDGYSSVVRIQSSTPAMWTVAQVRASSGSCARIAPKIERCSASVRASAPSWVMPRQTRARCVGRGGGQAVQADGPHGQRALDHVAQLAHVAGPAVRA